jgi:hypothetical protein
MVVRNISVPTLNCTKQYDFGVKNQPKPKTTNDIKGRENEKKLVTKAISSSAQRKAYCSQTFPSWLSFFIFYVLRFFFI